MSKTIEERFWSKVQKGEGCWKWLASKRKDGYGYFDQYHYAHRAAWALTYGPIPEGMCVCHRCDNPSCVRPDHLFLGTQADNVRDMHQKGRAVRAMARINLETAQEIRRVWKEKRPLLKDLAKEYGLSTSHVCGILKNNYWREAV